MPLFSFGGRLSGSRGRLQRDEHPKTSGLCNAAFSRFGIDVEAHNLAQLEHEFRDFRQPEVVRSQPVRLPDQDSSLRISSAAAKYALKNMY
jgi:hypothetical protein